MVLRLFVIAPYLPHTGPSSWLLSLLNGFHELDVKILVYVTGGAGNPGSMAYRFSSFCQVVVEGDLKNVAKAFDPDTILFWEFDAPSYFKDSKARKVLIHHGMGSYIPPDCDAIICLHEYIKELLPNYSGKTVVAYPAVSEGRMDENLKEKFNLTSPVAGFVGRMVPEKNISNLIKAVLRTDWSLLVAGDGPDITTISSLIKDSSKIKLLGVINNPWNIYKSVDLICLPSKIEGFSLVMIEAALSKTPMMLTKVGVAPHLFDETSVFWTDSNEGDISKTLEHIAKNLIVSKNMAEKAYSIISNRCTLNNFVTVCFNVCFPNEPYKRSI